MKKSLMLCLSLVIATACGSLGAARTATATPTSLPSFTIASTLSLPVSSSTIAPMPRLPVTAGPTLPPIYTGPLENLSKDMATFLTQEPQVGVTTPMLTATPLAVGVSSESAVAIIDGIFDRACVKDDLLTPVAPEGTTGFLGYHIGQPNFTDIPKWGDLQVLDIDEVADSLNQSYRAFEVEQLGSPTECPGCVLQSKLYLQDRQTGRLSRIDWNGYEPARFMFGLTWVGDTVLTFFQSLSPHATDLVGIDVKKRRFIYYALLSCP